jgi:clan AA aspartic protease (TIGR02281 family)
MDEGTIGREMTDYRPGDHRIVPRRERSIGGWVFLGLAILLLALGAWVYQFRPQWVARLYDLAGISLIDMLAQDDRADIEFAPLYQRYGMTPLGHDTAGDGKVSSLLTSLQKEPCDKYVILQASIALENLRAIRGAAEMLKGFANVCPDSGGERYHASELYYLLGDYDAAVKLSSDVINHRPDAQNAYFVRAKFEESQKRYAAAIGDYATLIRLVPNTKSIVSEVFTRMSDSYEKLNRTCEAIGPLQTYIALDSENRSTPPLLKRIAALAAKGQMRAGVCQRRGRTPRRASGVSTTNVEVNGVEGKFVFDTGATFVTLSRSFAARAKPRMLSTDSIEMQTANGPTSGSLASLDSVKLGGLSASGVPAIVARKNLGDNVDGLLGMSFLSRFTVVIDDREIQLKAKSLGE